MSKQGLSFLSNESVQLPVGGSLVPDLIAEWHAGVVYSFLGEVDAAAIASEGIAPALVVEKGGWTQCYFTSYEECEVAIEKLNIEGFRGGLRRPDRDWQFETPASKILNISRDDAPFGDPATFSVRVSTMKSKKYRHELHFMALPAAVAAAATAMGIENPGFSFRELLSPDAIFTDEFQEQMIGQGDNYPESVLWQRRVALWAALGESDPRKFQPIGTGTRYDTESENLGQCLMILARKWSRPIWGRLLLVPDPRVDSVYESSSGDTRRLSVPVLAEIYPDEATAQSAAKAGLEGGDSEAKAQGSATSAGPAPIPAPYADYPQLFHEAVARFKEKGVSGPPPVVLKAIGTDPDFQGCDPSVVLAWVTS